MPSPTSEAFLPWLRRGVAICLVVAASAFLLRLAIGREITKLQRKQQAYYQEHLAKDFERLRAALKEPPDSSRPIRELPTIDQKALNYSISHFSSEIQQLWQWQLWADMTAIITFAGAGILGSLIKLKGVRPPVSTAGPALDGDILVSHATGRLSNFPIVLTVAYGLLVVAAAAWGLLLHEWRMFFGAVPFVGLLMFFAWFLRRSRTQFLQSSLTIDSKRHVIEFRNFQFVASFLPEKPRAEETVPFQDILDVIYRPPDRGPATLALRTTRGNVTISGEMEHFDSIARILDELVERNKASPADYARAASAEPKVRTPWYGWLILIVTIASIVFIGWKCMYAD